MKFEVIVSGVVLTTTNSREEAEQLLDSARKSPLGWLHAPKRFYIREVNNLTDNKKKC
jgi:hypothetical protein